MPLTIPTFIPPKTPKESQQRRGPGGCVDAPGPDVGGRHRGGGGGGWHHAGCGGAAGRACAPGPCLRGAAGAGGHGGVQHVARKKGKVKRWLDPRKPNHWIMAGQMNYARKGAICLGLGRKGVQRQLLIGASCMICSNVPRGFPSWAGLCRKGA